MDENHWHGAGLEHVWLPYAQMKTAAAPLAVARTYGARIVLDDGRELVDGVASWWTACHGYNHPHIAMAVALQLEKIPHVMLGGLVHEQAASLARRLAALMPGDLDHVFFSESGSVSVEVALKMAVQYWRNQGRRGRTKFVAFKRWHRTFPCHMMFSQFLLPHFLFIDYDDRSRVIHMDDVGVL